MAHSIGIRWTLPLALALTMAAMAAPAMAAEGGGLGKYLPGYEIARYQPAQGRLVLEHDDEFLVLRKGDEVPGLPGVRLVSANRRGALLVEKSSDKGPDEAPQRWLRIVPEDGGGVRVIVISVQPDEGLQPPDVLPGLDEHMILPDRAGDPTAPAGDEDGGSR